MNMPTGPPQPAGPSGKELFNREMIQQNTKLDDMQATLKKMMTGGGLGLNSFTDPATNYKFRYE